MNSKNPGVFTIIIIVFPDLCLPCNKNFSLWHMAEEDSPSKRPVNTCDKVVNAESPALLDITTFPGFELDLDSKTFDTTSEMNASDLALNTAQ